MSYLSIYFIGVEQRAAGVQGVRAQTNERAITLFDRAVGGSDVFSVVFFLWSVFHGGAFFGGRLRC